MDVLQIGEPEQDQPELFSLRPFVYRPPSVSGPQRNVLKMLFATHPNMASTVLIADDYKVLILEVHVSRANCGSPVAGARFHLDDAGLQDSIFKSMPCGLCTIATKIYAQ
jgi:hypothetical protein